MRIYRGQLILKRNIEFDESKKKRLTDEWMSGAINQVTINYDSNNRLDQAVDRHCMSVSQSVKSVREDS